jgi:ferredoxin
MSERLRVDPIRCDGHGHCAELLPERIRLDEWGFPMIDGRPVPPELRRAARRAMEGCPRLALRLSEG